MVNGSICACNAGYAKGTLGECEACAPGKYQSAYGAWTACPQFTFAASSASTACTSCAGGWTTATEGSTACTACPVGTFRVPNSISSCVGCPLHSFANSTGSASCTGCARGLQTFSTGMTSCSACTSPNWYSLGTGAGCAACGANTVSTSSNVTACTVCPITTPLRSLGQSACTVPSTSALCASVGGWWWNSSRCTPCASGFYCVGNGQRQLCPESRFWSPTYSASGASCTQPPVPSALQVMCPVNTSATMAAPTYLLQCRAVSGSYGPPGEASTVCPQDFYCPRDSLEPIACPTDTYSNAGASACVPYVPAPCRDGWYASFWSDWTQCLECPEGAYCSGSGIFGCNELVAWRSPKRAYSASQCYSSPIGCTVRQGDSCPLHTTSGGPLCSQSAFMQCRANAGYYFNLPIVLGSVGLECPPNFYCPARALYPIPCPITPPDATCGPGYDAPMRSQRCPNAQMSEPMAMCTKCAVTPAHGRLIFNDTCAPCCDTGYMQVAHADGSYTCEALSSSCPPGQYASLSAERCLMSAAGVSCRNCPLELEGLQLLPNVASASGFGVHTCPYACAAGLGLSDGT
jgi:Tyrosine-protein kinase ephrin type A/B receptor-like